MPDQERETVNVMTGVEVTEGLEDAIPQLSALDEVFDSTPFPAIVEQAVADATVLLSFSHILRFRVGKDFANGPWEGRLRLEFGDHVVSGKTLQDIHSQLATKAAEVLAEKAAHEKKVAERRG